MSGQPKACSELCIQSKTGVLEEFGYPPQCSLAWLGKTSWITGFGSSLSLILICQVSGDWSWQSTGCSACLPTHLGNAQGLQADQRASQGTSYLFNEKFAVEKVVWGKHSKVFSGRKFIGGVKERQSKVALCLFDFRIEDTVRLIEEMDLLLANPHPVVEVTDYLKYDRKCKQLFANIWRHAVDDYREIGVTRPWNYGNLFRVVCQKGQSGNWHEEGVQFPAWLQLLRSNYQPVTHLLPT